MASTSGLHSITHDHPARMGDTVDVAIIGAGPIGIACAVECQNRGLSVIVYDSGSLCDTLRRYPTHMRFFSTSQQLEIAGHPFASVNPKPSRDEALAYYRAVALAEKVPLQLYQRVERIDDDNGALRIISPQHRTVARRVIIATGFFQHPVTLSVPGEELPNVSHYFTDGHAYAAQDVLIVGGANSAVIAALECWRMGAKVTIVHRGNDFYTGVKYWLLPDIQNRIKEGSITAHFLTHVTKIEPHCVHLRSINPADHTHSDWTLPNDWVLACTGYRSDYQWLRQLGITLGETNQPLIDETYQAFARPGVYLAGCVLGGDDTGSIFIENSRHHAVEIASHIAKELKSPSTTV